MPSALKGVIDSEGGAWASALLWAAILYVTIPFSRQVQAAVTELAGRQMFTVFVSLCAAASLCASFRYRRVPLEPRLFPPALILIAAAAAAAGGALSLSGSPEESIHIAEYGVLSALLFRAINFRIKDGGSYIIAALLGSIAGTADELIQWAAPARVFDFRDVALNAGATVLVQAALAWGICPSTEPGISKRSGKIVLLHLAVLGSLVILALLRGDIAPHWT